MSWIGDILKAARRVTYYLDLVVRVRTEAAAARYDWTQNHDPTVVLAHLANIEEMVK